MIFILFIVHVSNEKQISENLNQSLKVKSIEISVEIRISISYWSFLSISIKYDLFDFDF